MLEVKNITKIYSKNGKVFTALNNLSLKVDEGDFIAIVGPSGSGKSTLLNTIGGLIQPNSGEILFRNKNVYSLKKQEANQYRKNNVGFVFQQFHLIPYLTVFENIKMSDNGSLDKHTITDYLQKCDLFNLRNKYPSELSVGEKQRTAFIRAIISKPDMLLADEPTGNLDPENSRILMSLIADFHKQGGTVLLVTHQVETSKYANRTITLCEGEIELNQV